LVEQRILGIDQAWGTAWFVRAKSGCDIILVTCEKLVELGVLPRIRCKLGGKDKPV